MGHMILLSFPAISFSPRFEKLKVDLKTGSQQQLFQKGSLISLLSGGRQGGGVGGCNDNVFVVSRLVTLGRYLPTLADFAHRGEAFSRMGGVLVARDK